MSEFEYFKGIARRMHPWMDLSGIQEHAELFCSCPVHNPRGFLPPKPDASATAYLSELLQRYVLPRIDATQAKFIKEDLDNGEWGNALSNLGAAIGKVAGDYE